MASRFNVETATVCWTEQIEKTVLKLLFMEWFNPSLCDISVSYYESICMQGLQKA